jgi:hypothetical protein
MTGQGQGNVHLYITTLWNLSKYFETKKSGSIKRVMKVMQEGD